jgi:hypothetical protein
VLSSDLHTESRASMIECLTWRRLLEFHCAIGKKTSKYTSCASTGRVAWSATGTPAASGRLTSLEGALHVCGMAGSGGAGVQDTSSNGWALKAALVLILVFARSHILSVAAKKYGGE